MFFLSIVVMFIQGTVGFVKKYTWSLALAGEFAVADNGTLRFWEMELNSICIVKGALQ